MSVRIISPLGKLWEVEVAMPVVEKSIKFNGGKKFFGEICKNGAEPNGIVFRFVKQGMFRFDELVIGNLKTEKVKEIMRDLLIKGYYDFSSMEFQEADTMDKIYIDDGKSYAYTNEITSSIFNNYSMEMDGILGSGFPLATPMGPDDTDESFQNEEDGQYDFD